MMDARRQRVKMRPRLYDEDGMLELLLLSDVRIELEQLMYAEELSGYLSVLLAPQPGPDGRPFRRARRMIDGDIVATRGAFLDALEQWSDAKYAKRDAATRRPARISRRSEVWS